MNAGQWHGRSILSFEKAHRTLEEMARRHGTLVSRMASIQSPSRRRRYQLVERLFLRPGGQYAAASRALTAEAYEICDKLSLVVPLDWNRRIAYALTSFDLADIQSLDGLSPDLELFKKAERLWSEVLRFDPKNISALSQLVVIRRRLAEELTDRGQSDDAAGWDRRSLDTGRGKPELLYLLAIDYARNAGFTGKLPNRLTTQQLQKRRRRFEDGAIAMLRQAAADGFKDVARLRGESTFEPLRAHPDFAAILADIAFPAQPFSGDRG